MRTPRTLVPLAVEGADGRNWYAHAATEIVAAWHMLPAYIPLSVFTDLFALFSPRTSVTRNIKDTLHFTLTNTFPPHLMVPVRTSITHYLTTGEIRGPKVYAFARALSGDPDSIVLDVWMARLLGVPDKSVATVAIRTEAERRVRSTARTLGWTPAETQAALWHTSLRRAGRNPTPYLITPHLKELQ